MIAALAEIDRYQESYESESHLQVLESLLKRGLDPSQPAMEAKALDEAKALAAWIWADDHMPDD